MLQKKKGLTWEDSKQMTQVEVSSGKQPCQTSDRKKEITLGLQLQNASSSSINVH